MENIDALSQASWARRSEASTRSHISDRASLISSVPGGVDEDVRLTPQQYGVLGKSQDNFIIIIIIITVLGYIIVILIYKIVNTHNIKFSTEKIFKMLWKLAYSLKTYIFFELSNKKL